MNEKEGLINKIKHLLHKIGAPRWLHQMGPKTYELWQHVLALFIKEECKFSYRRTTQFLRNMGIVCATKSTLQRYAYKLKIPFWQRILDKTVGKINNYGAIDGTCMARTSVSWHYVKRIDDKTTRQGYKLSMLTTTKNKILSIRLRAKLAHDTKDVKYLLKKAARIPKTLLMDKGYDAEWIHQHCKEKKITSIIPPRKNARKGKRRKELKKKFPRRIYNKRSNIESTYHAIKQKYGNNINSKHIKTARTQTYIRAILHNISKRIKQLLGQSRS